MTRTVTNSRVAVLRPCYLGQMTTPSDGGSDRFAEEADIDTIEMELSAAHVLALSRAAERAVTGDAAPLHVHVPESPPPVASNLVAIDMAPTVMDVHPASPAPEIVAAVAAAPTPVPAQEPTSAAAVSPVVLTTAADTAPPSSPATRRKPPTPARAD